MTTPLTRREMIAGSAAAASSLCLGRYVSAATPKVKVKSLDVISKQPHLYNGWPTLTRRKDGQLLVVCSGGRESHVCPFGRVEMMRSNDGGATWSWPRILMDGAIDDRDAGVLVTAKGSILITTFTSLAFEATLRSAEQKKGDRRWSDERLARWIAARDRIPAEQRNEELGVWMIRSTDGGVTWSSRYDCEVNSPHGPIQLSDGRVLYAGKELWKGEYRIGVAESSDDGQSWRWLAEIPTRPGDDHKKYHELHAVEAENGHIIAHIRNHNSKNAGETLQSESTDGGKTWSVPHSIGVWGLPSHLMKLRDGRLLMSYGHRRPPFGNQIRISSDNGKTWSQSMIISGDGAGHDLGYPSTVQIDDGSFVTVWYELLKGSTRAVLRQARWSLS